MTPATGGLGTPIDNALRRLPLSTTLRHDRRALYRSWPGGASNSCGAHRRYRAGWARGIAGSRAQVVNAARRCHIGRPRARAAGAAVTVCRMDGRRGSSGSQLSQPVKRSPPPPRSPTSPPRPTKSPTPPRRHQQGPAIRNTSARPPTVGPLLAKAAGHCDRCRTTASTAWRTAAEWGVQADSGSRWSTVGS